MLHVSLNAGNFMGFLLQFAFGICNDTKKLLHTPDIKKQRKNLGRARFTQQKYFSPFPPNLWIDREFMNWSAYAIPTLWISLMDFTILGPIAYLMSSWTNSHSSSLMMKPLPVFFYFCYKTVYMGFEALLKCCCFLVMPVFFYSVFRFKTEFSSNCNTILATSVPQTIHSLSLSSSSMRPVAAVSPLTSLFSC